jgi:hypothetical protein
MNKVDFVFRTFFYSEHIHSVMIQDVTDVIVETGFFFAKLKLVDRGYTEGIIEIDYLNRDEAITARRIIQGLVIANEQKIDLIQLDPQEVRDKIEALGRVKRTEPEIKPSN